MGERVVDVIGRTAPQCIVSELFWPADLRPSRTTSALAMAAERFGFLAREPLDERYGDLVDKTQVGNRVFDDQDVEIER